MVIKNHQKNSHKDPPTDEPVLAPVPIEAEMLMPAEKPLLLGVRGAVGDTNQPLRLTQSTLPILSRHVYEGRIHALQVVHSRARLTTQQIP